jgi:hypothetical protein
MGCASISKKPSSLRDYCEFFDTTGRYIPDDKANSIDKTHSFILERLSLNSAQWMTLTTEFKNTSATPQAVLMMNTFKAIVNGCRE